MLTNITELNSATTLFENAYDMSFSHLQSLERLEGRFYRLCTIYVLTSLALSFTARDQKSQILLGEI